MREQAISRQVIALRTARFSEPKKEGLSAAERAHWRRLAQLRSQAGQANRHPYAYQAPNKRPKEPTPVKGIPA